MDYEKLGFRCGIEIHQQLETHKLFCNCPSLVNDESKPDVIIKRKIRAVAGETGEVDKAAAFEKQRNRAFIYEACKTSSCLVELDEEPPHEVNKEALETALEIALLLNAKPVDQIQFMRKTVIDGSNVSGFQRTALIATEGYIQTSKGNIAVPTVCLEEEAAKKIKEENNTVTYRLDRLGVALVEIATDASIKDNEHAKECASIIGMILRSTGKVKRGIGTIRQDVNVSIAGKSRVEIKGFQELRSIPLVIENEVKRQMALKESKPEVRKANPDGSSEFLRPMPGAARMYPETDVKPIIVTKEMISAIKLPELLTEAAIRLEKQYNINADLANSILKEEVDFEKYAMKFTKIEPTFIATALVIYPKEIKRKHNVDADKITEEQYNAIFGFLAEGKISKEAVIELMKDAAEGKKIDISRFSVVSDEELKKGLKAVVEANKGAPMGALMGEAMKKFRGKADGKKIMDLMKAIAGQ
ncbi:MAG: Glu-tRNA(Gln) amidotransferase subunit GatE [Candidatus Nanoarchaeia archaeon]|nr:Glu-tRNA(Gln) amidotransferase subunit GatE [Candidatus Nanoarchaeia archaeon]